jgi:PAS domain S-box-containing protein
LFWFFIYLFQLMADIQPEDFNGYPFLSGGGQMGESIRSINWAANPLGSPGAWPDALKHTVSMLLKNTFPTLICWGPDCILLFNDAFRPINGAAGQTGALRAGTSDINAGIWEAIGPMFGEIMAGKTHYFPSRKIQVDRKGQLEDCYFDLSCSPIADLEGKIHGILVICVATTEKVRSINETAESESRFDMQNPGLGYLESKTRRVGGLGQGQHFGDKSYVTGVLHDITERKRIEQIQDDYTKELQSINEEMAASNEELATTNEELTEIQQRLEDVNRELAASASRLQMAIESTSLGTWEYSPLTGELYWSKECRAIYGIPADQPITFESFSGHIHPDDRKWVEQQMEKYISPDFSGRYDLSYRIIRFDNEETRWIKVQGTVFFEEGQASRFIGTVLDITEMKVAEEKSAKLGAIIQSSDDAIISKTLESVITSWNDSAERIFGYTAAEMIGETIYKLIPHDRQQEEPQILARLRTGERVEHFETKRVTKDGRLVDVSVTVSPVKDNDGHIIGLSKIARDITERKLDESRKNDFIGMVSHELKTPLTSLNAIIQVANVKLKNSEDSFLAGAMQKANQQVKRMTAIINGFLNISRLESGKILIEKQVFELNELITDIIEETRLTMTTHRIHFLPLQPVHVNADREKISSVISNLISNAIKYSPQGQNIELQCMLEGKNVVVSVKDEGMGIKPQDLDKVFDRYYRVESNNTRHIAGFGIGLYLSSEIIERHNGRLWAESEIGKGSTFYFLLPLD